VFRNTSARFFNSIEKLAMNKLSHLILPFALMFGVNSALAADPETGRQKAQMCAACHGPMGLATMPNTPNLAGQPELYMVEQLKAYRSGKRAHDQMSFIAKPLSDDDIANVSAWYASLQIQIKN
jgi:cytochrome c553